MDPPHMAVLKARRPARTYIQQLCEDTVCSQKTCLRRWTIGKSGERGSGISCYHHAWWWWWWYYKWVYKCLNIINNVYKEQYFLTACPKLCSRLIWFGLVLCHINNIGHLMPNPFYLSICLFVWVLCHINFCRLFNAKSIFIQINSSISNNSV